MREPYSKHKDRSPKDTVGSIVSTLEEVGLSTEVRWTSHPFEGLCSNRVTIAGTNIGTNGKGTSEEYCLASGYAEFMERLQNNILGSTALTGAQIFERRGFLAAPDERNVTPAQIESRRDPVLEGWLATFGVNTSEERVALLEALLQLDYARGDGTLAELPFAAPEGEGDGGGEGRIVWLPAALVYRLCGSNGMAAGNTLEEALVQGLSEIFERHAEAEVLRGKAVPPRVPKKALEATGLMPTIARIEEGGRYQVHPAQRNSLRPDTLAYSRWPHLGHSKPPGHLRPIMCGSHASSVPNLSMSSAMLPAIPLGAFCEAVLAFDFDLAPSLFLATSHLLLGLSSRAHCRA